MNTNRKTARTAGVLFIIAIVSGILGVALTQPILDAPNHLMKISANQNLMITGTFFLFIMAAACAGIGISLYPVLKEYDQALALGSAGFRIIEAVFHIAGALGLLLLLALSREFVKAGAPDLSYFQTLSYLLEAGRDWVSHVAAILPWCTGALIYYYIFYRTKMVPRWLSIWGLIGIALVMAASMLFLFSLIGSLSTIQVVLNLPIALQELVLAIWLIVKGFDPPAFVSRSV